MDENRVVIGAFYRHFKGNVYQVKTIAKDCDSLEDHVIYQAMYPPFGTWSRKLSEFVSVVDVEKYPEAKQKYRFQRMKESELTEDATLQKVEVKKIEVIKVANPETAGDKEEQKPEQTTTDQELRRALVSGRAQDYLPDSISAEEIAHRGMLQILDETDYKEKRHLLVGLKPYLDEKWINNIALAMDLVLEEGTLEEKYESLLHCIDTFARYDGGRLR